MTDQTEDNARYWAVTAGGILAVDMGEGEFPRKAYHLEEDQLFFTQNEELCGFSAFGNLEQLFEFSFLRFCELAPDIETLKAKIEEINKEIEKHEAAQ